MANKLPPASGWLSILESKLSKKAFNQFERSAAKTSCAMLDEIILPNVYKPRKSFLALTHDKITSRDHGDAQTWAEALEIGLRAEIEPWVTTFFTNALQPVPQDHLLYRHPSDRVVFGGPTVFTFEFDKKDLTFFEQQCAWVRSKNKDINCRMGDVYRALSSYADFIGITVVWSGNKSFHIHIMFDPAPMLAQAESLRDCPPRAGMAQHWQRLKIIIMPILNPVVGEDVVEPDSTLQFPDPYRRLPLGTRVHDGENFFGFPLGTRVPQLVMWEKIRKLAAPGSSAMFFSAALFTEQRAKLKEIANRNRAAAVAKALPPIFSKDEMDHFEKKIRETFPDGFYPEFVRFGHDSDGWKAMFRNHAGDKTPTSVMKENFAGVLISGGNPLQLQNGTPRLPMTLGECFAFWALDLRPKTWDIFDDGYPDGDEEDDLLADVVHVLGEGHVTGASIIEQDFARRATTREATASATREFFRSALMHSCIWVKGPEGSGKTSQIMELLPRRLDMIGNVRKVSPRAMFAFADYRAAIEKCEEFNNIQAKMDTIYRGILTPSFSKLYDMALKDLGMPTGDKITVLDAAKKKCPSIWVAVQMYQPKVIAWMADFHERAYGAHKGRCPIFFTVHDVAERWKSCTYSRLMWGRHFWKDTQRGVEPKQRDEDARKDTHLAVMVHDEIDADKVVAIEKAEVVEWVRSLVRSEPAVWDTLGTSLAETYASYERFKKKVAFPLVQQTQEAVSFDKVREIFHLGVEQWCELTLTDDGAYEDTRPELSLYRECVADGHLWVAKPRLWWRGSVARPVADTLVVLTTEMLPTATIERADPDAFKIFSLETPYIERDTVDVYLDRTVNSNSMSKVCSKFQEKLSPGNPGSICVISDKVEGKIDGSQTHISARGSNDYIGKHVLQTMSFMAPAQHETMLAFNAFTGRDDCVALWHLDRFNQTAGRNIGFRKRGDATHTLVVHPRIYDLLLQNGGWVFSRYDLTVHLSQRQREHLKGKAALKDVIEDAVAEPAPELIASEIIVPEFGGGEPMLLPASMVESEPEAALAVVPSMWEKIRCLQKTNER